MKDKEELTIGDYVKLGLVGIGIIFLIVTIFNSFKIVETGNIGIVKRFGKVNRTTDSGLVLKIPFIEKIVKMDVRVQKEETASTGATKDLQDVTGNLALNYSVDKETAIQIYNNLGESYKDNIIVPALHESFKTGVAQYTAEELITKRAEAKENILNSIKTRLAEYGITVTDLNIVNLNFSESFNNAIEAKAVAQQEVETAKQELEKAKIDAEKKKAEAEGEAAAQRAQQQTLTDLMIKKMWIEKWNGELPQYASDDSGFIINMGN